MLKEVLKSKASSMTHIFMIDIRTCSKLCMLEPTHDFDNRGVQYSGVRIGATGVNLDAPLLVQQE